MGLTKLEVLGLEDQHIQQRLALVLLALVVVVRAQLAVLLPVPSLLQRLLQNGSREILRGKKEWQGFEIRTASRANKKRRQNGTDVDDLHLRGRLVPPQLKQWPDRPQLESMGDRALDLVERGHERERRSTVRLLGRWARAGQGRGWRRLGRHLETADLGSKEKVDRGVEREAAKHVLSQKKGLRGELEHVGRGREVDDARRTWMSIASFASVFPSSA